jgi:hypothetical protein
MDILITGGSGFVGRFLSQRLLTAGHRITIVGRGRNPRAIARNDLRYMAADTTHEGPWQAAAAGSDAIINLAGCSIFRRWTDQYKRKLYDSRVLTTRHLVEALPPEWNGVLLSASAVGYYGDRGDDIITESEPCQGDFLGTLSRDWEAEALKADEKGARVALMRFGIVLGRDGGALAMMRRVFKLFAGGPIGDGSQWFPWIHMTDLAAAACFLLEAGRAAGPFNLCAPAPVRNHELAHALGRALHRPAVMPAPAFLVRTVMGEFAESLLASCRAVPERLLAAGFAFRFPDIATALLDLLVSGNASSVVAP